MHVNYGFTQDSESIVDGDHDDFAVSGKRSSIMEVSRAPRKSLSMDVNHHRIKLTQTWSTFFRTIIKLIVAWVIWKEQLLFFIIIYFHIGPIFFCLNFDSTRMYLVCFAANVQLSALSQLMKSTWVFLPIISLQKNGSPLWKWAFFD